MNGAEFIRRLRRYAQSRALFFREDAKRGKGDHRMVYLGARSTVVPDLRHEIRKGTLHGICRQLGVRVDEL